MDLKNEFFDVGDIFDSDAADERNRRIDRMVTDDDLRNVFFDENDEQNDSEMQEPVDTLESMPKSETVPPIYNAPPAPEPIEEPEPVTPIYSAPPAPEPIEEPEPVNPIYNAPPAPEPIEEPEPVTPIYSAPQAPEPIEEPEPVSPIYSAPPASEPIEEPEPVSPIYNAPQAPEPIEEPEPVNPIYNAPPAPEPIEEPEPVSPIYNAPPASEPIDEPEPVKLAYDAVPNSAVGPESDEEKYYELKKIINQKYRNDTMERKDVDNYIEIVTPILEKAGLGDKLKQICVNDDNEQIDFRKQFLNIKRLMKSSSIILKGRDK